MRLMKGSAILLVLAALVSMPASAQRYACVESTQGNWCMEFLWKQAPRNVANFMLYVNAGSYSNMVVHYGIQDFLYETGAYTIDASNQLGIVGQFGSVPNEAGASNVRGSVAMYISDGAPDSANSPWFVNVADNSSALDIGGYSVFAQVVQGMDIIDKIGGLYDWDLSSSLGQDFFSIPLDLPASATSVSRSNLVIINRIYGTDLLPGTTAAPYHCSTPVPNETLTEVCAGTVSFPVNIKGQGFYDITLQLVSSSPKVVLATKPGSLKPLATAPAVYASYDQAAGVLTLPSVRTGTFVYSNLTLKLTDQATQQFTLQGFTH